MALKDSYLTVSEVAKKIGVTRQTISRWIRDGDLDAEKIGRETIISKEELERYRNRKFIAEVAGFDAAIVTAIISYIRRKYKYDKDDVIEQMGDDLVFDITHKDGTKERAEVISFTFQPNKINIKPYKESKGGNKT